MKISNKKMKKTNKKAQSKIKMPSLKKQKKLKQRNRHIHHTVVRLELNMVPFLSQKKMIKLRTKE